MPAGTVTVTAEFERVYTVTFNAMGGTGGPASVTVTAGSQVNAPDVTEMAAAISNPANTPFGGWFTDTTLRYPVTFPITVTENIEVYAKWDNKYVLVAGEKKDAWQVAGQVVQLTAGTTYKLGAEYKVGRIAASSKHAHLIISVQWVSDGTLQSTAWFRKFDEGNNTTWTRTEVDFEALVTGWYRIGIEDSSRNYVGSNGGVDNIFGNRKAYANRVWLYPQNATSAEENYLLDADFAGNHLPTTDYREGERFLDVPSGAPFDTNNNIPSWINYSWGPQCAGWWGRTGGNLWLESNPSIDNY
jgi:hypothetical protein